MIKILFQGDSITDAGRNREILTDLGKGYAKLVACEMEFEAPGTHEFINRGISGNRIVDVYARIKKDIINLQPDVMSLMIGVNDVWHEFGHQNGVDAKKFEMIYELLIEEIKEALPDIKIILLGAYVENGAAIVEREYDYPLFRAEVEKRAQIAEKIAEKYGFPFVDLQKKFDEAIERGPLESFTRDGVHPTIGGIELIKRAWLEAYKTV